jgi:CRP-like cAMP-binding protein
MYVIRTGRVRLSSDHNVVYQYLGPGEVFGERLFSRGETDQMAVALTPLSVDAYRGTELIHRLEEDGRFARKLLSGLAARIDDYERRIADFVTVQAQTRLARLFLRLLPRRLGADWVHLPISPSNLELASAIGTTRWRVSHFIGQFQQFGWLRREHGFWIHPEKLKAYVKGT